MEVIHDQARQFGFAYEEIYYPISEESERKVDCFYCALRRRTAMIKLCFEKGYNKIAFGHHLDDIIETLLMNMVHHGNISTMPPRVDLFDGQIAIIRPLAFVLEEQCRDYASSQIFVPPKCRCTGLDESVRRETKEFIEGLQQDLPDIKSNLLAFLQTVRRAQTDRS